jgi:alpha-beta hydrolase superfamily lysophospholipase
MITAAPITVGRFSGLHADGHEASTAVLLVHGAFSCPNQLRPLVEAFAGAGYPAFALALRGHDSPGRISGATVADYVDDVREQIATIGRPVIVVGHSMGGLLALKVAEAGDCAAAVLVAAPPAGPVFLTRHSLSAYARLLAPILAGRDIPPPIAALRNVSVHGVAHERAEAILREFVPESGVAMRDMALGAVKVDPRAISVPLLYVFGRSDRLIPPWQMRRAARALGATVREYDGVGHFLFEEPAGQRVVPDMIAWCRRVATGSTSVAASRAS